MVTEPQLQSELDVDAKKGGYNDAARAWRTLHASVSAHAGNIQSVLVPTGLVTVDTIEGAEHMLYFK